MALTPSTMLPLGTSLPRALIEQQLASGAAQLVSGALQDPDSWGQGPLLVLFLCAHCPFVQHIEPELTRLEADWAAPGRLQMLAICSNSIRSHPQDGPQGLRAQAAARGWRFAYLWDSSQQLARAFRAACTPDLFLFAAAGADGLQRLVYRGQLDGSRPGQPGDPDGADLRRALVALEAGRSMAADQRPAIGCNIKWHPGEEPEWAR